MLDEGQRLASRAAYEKLDEQERTALYRRARRLTELQEELMLELPETTRKRLENLEPDKRRRVLRDMLEDELRDRGLRVHETLPSELADDLETAAPSERRRLLRDFDRGGRRTRLANLARELDVDLTELGDLATIDDEELDVRLQELRRKLIERGVEDHGLPRWLTVDQWNELSSLDNSTFTRRWRLYRRRDEAKADEASVVADGADGARRKNPFERLLRSLRPDPAWHVEHSHLTADERRDAVYRMAKRRSLKLMNQLSIDAGEIERFEDLDAGPAFIEAVRELSRQYRDESR